MNSGYVGIGGRERERGGLKGEHGGESQVAIGGGEHAVPGSGFHSLSAIASSLHFFACLPLGALVHPQQWLFRSGLA